MENKPLSEHKQKLKFSTIIPVILIGLVSLQCVVGAFYGSLKVKVAPREEAQTLIAAILALILPIKGELYEPK
jgi:hypothetical protein